MAATEGVFLLLLLPRCIQLLESAEIAPLSSIALSSPFTCVYRSTIQAERKSVRQMRRPRVGLARPTNGRAPCAEKYKLVLQRSVELRAICATDSAPWVTNTQIRGFAGRNKIGLLLSLPV